jgi:hypothetical protein
MSVPAYVIVKPKAMRRTFVNGSLIPAASKYFVSSGRYELSSSGIGLESGLQQAELISSSMRERRGLERTAYSEHGHRLS